MTPNQRFRALFRPGALFVCMGAFDAITAKLAEASRAQAIFVALPKKCGHFAGKQLVSQQDIMQKLKAMVEARRDPDFFIVARADAIAVNGLEDAIARLTAYAAAGADGLYADAVESVEQMRELSRRLTPLRKPLLFNMVTSGKSPALSLKEVGELGFDFALCPVAPLLARHKAVKDMMETVYAAGCDTRAITGLLTPFAEYNTFIGLPEAIAREARFTQA